MSDLPDARDGLTREQRVILHVMHTCKAEYGDRSVPSAVIYGRVCEQLPMSKRRFVKLLQQLVGR